MQINEVEFNPNYIQTVVDEIDEFLREFGFRNKYQRNIRGGRYDNFYQIFFDWYSTKILTGEESTKIELKLKKIQRKLLKDMNVLMSFSINASESITINFRNWFFKRIKPPKYIYHSTDSLEKVKSILKTGLIPKSSEESERWKKMSLSFPELIFFETEPNRNRWGRYIFKIDTDDLKDYKFYTDINLDARNEGFIGNSKIRALVTNKSIPPDKIELMDKNHVNKFIDESYPDFIKNKHNINENKLNLKLKSRSKEQEEEGVEFYSNKILNGEYWEYEFIPDNIFEKLPYELKLKYIKKTMIHSDWGLTDNMFEKLPYELKLKYIEMSIENGKYLSDNKFNFAPDNLKLKYVEMCTGETTIKRRLFLTDNQFNFAPNNLKLKYEKWYKESKKENNITENKLNLKTKDNSKDKVDFLKQKGINNSTREFFMKDGEIDKSILPHLDKDMLDEINNYIKKFNEIIKLIPFESDGTLQTVLLRDIKDEYDISDKDIRYYIDVAKEKFQKEREKDLKLDVEFVMDEFSEIPSFTEFYEMFLKLTDPYFDYSKEEVRKMFLKLTTNPNQLRLFEGEKLWKLIYSPTKEIIIKGHYSLCKWKLNELKKSVPTNSIGNYKIVPL